MRDYKGVNMIPRSALLREKAVVLRTAGSFNEFGEWIKAQPAETLVDCVSAPDNGAERVLDASGASRQGRRFFWFGPEADISVGSGTHTAHLVRYPAGPAGELFRVIQIDTYPRSHIRATGERVVS